MENIKQVLTVQIAAAHFGCEVLSAPYGGQPDRKLVGAMIGLGKIHIDIKYPEWQSPHQVLIEVCQLILKPLIEISDKDAVALVDEVMKIYPDYDEGWKVTCGKRAARTMNHPYGPLSPEYSMCLIDFLRSKGYDCGYGDMPSLIKAGIAISENCKN